MQMQQTARNPMQLLKSSPDHLQLLDLLELAMQLKLTKLYRELATNQIFGVQVGSGRGKVLQR